MIIPLNHAESTFRLVIASNRLPLVVARGARAGWQVKSGSGGLITALDPVLRARGGVWMGFPGVVEEDEAPVRDLLTRAATGLPYGFEPIDLTRRERNRYYHGFSNEIIWPLFHDLQSKANFDPSYWAAYGAVNQKFAHALTGLLRPNDFIWIHDYHLMQVGAMLRRTHPTTLMGFFLHIPFPPPDIFVKLPWRSTLLEGLLSFDLVGLQTRRDTRNLLACLQLLSGHDLLVGNDTGAIVRTRSGYTRIGTFPISIDVDAFLREATEPAVERRVRQVRERYAGRKIILGIDRLNYTKGIIHKLLAFRLALESHPELRRSVILLQVVVPSREPLPYYDELKRDVERLVGEINGLFTEPGWVPIHYLYRSLPRAELLALYRAAHIAAVTPLKDGMNLVAKEYCAVNVGEDGVLVLSEFAGAAAQLQQHALLVNPYDRIETANALHRAVRMGEAERRQRMQALRQSIRQRDVRWWANTFLDVALAREPVTFPEVEDYVPAAGSP